MGSEPGESAESRVEESEPEASPDEGSNPESKRNGVDRGQGSDSKRSGFGAVQSSGVQRSASAGAAGGGRARDASSGTGTVDYDSGPNHAALSERYGLSVRSGEGARLQRLEKEFGSAKVQRWADEGMTVPTMGKARDMKAFRQRQADRPEEVPTDIERRNEASLHRNSEGGDDGPAGDAGAPESVRNVVSSPGKSMDDSVRGEMESKMGGDFSDVQMHTGPKAAAAADSINARAFTVGNHVAFNRGEYQPDTESGKEVLAHELTHVRQQTSGAVSMLPAEDAQLEIDPDPKLEKEAQETAETVTNDDSWTVRRMGTEMHVQRLPEATSASAPAAGSADSVAIQRDSSADSSSSESGGGNNVKDTHVVQPGETLQGIASSYGIENWRTLWKQNADKIDNPNLLFPNQTLEIPADESAVPDKSLGSPKGEPTPAPKNDLRTEKPKQTPPEVPPGEKQKIEGEQPEEMKTAKKPETAEQAPKPEKSSGPGTRPIDATGATGLDTIPETRAQTPQVSEEDEALQGTLGDLESGVDEVVDEDVTGQSGEPKGPDLAGNAQEAANEPPAESKGEDQTEHISVMDEAQSAAPDFDKGAFKETLKSRVDDATPENIEQLDGFSGSDDLDQLEKDMEGQVKEESESTEKPVAEQTEQEPPSTPDEGEDVDLDQPEKEQDLDPAPETGAATRPKPRSKEEVEQPMEAVKKDIDEPLEDKEFDEKDMAASPHEEISKPGKEAQKIKQDADATKVDAREIEQEHLQAAEQKQGQVVDEKTQQLNQQRASDLQAVANRQQQTKREDESVRQEVFSKVNSIYDDTKTKVEERLTQMETKVQEILDTKVAEVRTQFEQDVEKAKDESTGFASWFKRTFWIGDDMNKNFEKARQNFIENMKTMVIDAVANAVAKGMKEVGEIIKSGQKQVEEYLNSLPDERRQVAQEAAQQMNEKFAGLKQKAQQAKQNISDTVIQRYEKEQERVNSKLKKAKEEVEEARWSFKPPFLGIIGQVVGAISTLKKAVSNIAASIPSWSTLVSRDWGEVLSDIGDVFVQFGEYFMDWGNIIKTMFKALLQWLEFDKVVGDLSQISLPTSVTDVSGIVGMGWDIFKGVISGGYLKQRAASAWSNTKINAGEQTETFVEATFKLLEGGVGFVDDFKGMVQKVQENVGDLDTGSMDLAETVTSVWGSLKGGDLAGVADKVVDAITNSGAVDLLGAVLNPAITFVSEQVITAAISKLKALAGPVGAAIELIENVYKLVMFIIDNASRYIGIIQSFAQFVFGVIKGATGRAANLLIDGVTAVLPMLFDFIAKAIAGTGVGDKIRNIFMKGKEEIDKFFDWALAKIEPFMLKMTETLYPMFFGAGALAGDEEGEEGEEGEDDSSGSRRESSRTSGDSASGGETSESGSSTTTGGRSSGTAEDGKQGGTGGATSRMKRISESIQVAMGEKVRVKDPETGKTRVMKPGDIDDDLYNKLDDTSRRRLKQAEVIANVAGAEGIDTSKIGLEQKMYAVELSVLAERGELGEHGARRLLNACELEEMISKANVDPVEFVSKPANARKIRRALVRDLAANLEPSQVEATVDKVKPEHVWDESEKKFTLNYTSMLGNALNDLSKEFVSNRRRDREKQRYDEMKNRGKLQEAAYHTVKNDPRFETGDMTDEEIIQEIERLNDAQYEAITGASPGNSVEEVNQVLQEARSTRARGSGREGGQDGKGRKQLPDPDETVGQIEAGISREELRQLVKESDKVDMTLEELDSKLKNDIMDNIHVDLPPDGELTPELAQEIKKDPEAVFGYQPREGSEEIPDFIKEVDWTDPEEATAAQKKRLKEYILKNQKVKSELDRMKDFVENDEYFDIEDLARDRVFSRNAGRILTYVSVEDQDRAMAILKQNADAPAETIIQQLKKEDSITIPQASEDDDEDPEERLRNVLTRNEEKYGNAFGPSPEYLKEQKRSWHKVTYSSVKSNEAVDVLFGLYRLVEESEKANQSGTSDQSTAAGES